MWARYSLANFALAAPNAAAASATHEARDVLVALAWAGSGTFWLWTTTKGGK